MISKKQIGCELRKKIDEGLCAKDIGEWAYTIYYYNTSELDSELWNIIIRLVAMMMDLNLNIARMNLEYLQNYYATTKRTLSKQLMN